MITMSTPTISPSGTPRHRPRPASLSWASTSSASTLATSSAPSTPKTPKVILVEDEPLQRITETRKIKAAGLQNVDNTATSFIAARNKLKEAIKRGQEKNSDPDFPDVVITDNNLNAESEAEEKQTKDDIQELLRKGVLSEEEATLGEGVALVGLLDAEVSNLIKQGAPVAIRPKVLFISNVPGATAAEKAPIEQKLSAFASKKHARFIPKDQFNPDRINRELHELQQEQEQEEKTRAHANRSCCTKLSDYVKGLWATFFPPVENQQEHIV